MYSVKQNQLIMGALPLADVTVYYIDVRSVGKGYDEFYQQAKDMGAELRQGPRLGHHGDGRAATSSLRYEDIENGGASSRPSTTWSCSRSACSRTTRSPSSSATGSALALDDYYYVGEADEDLDPGRTNLPGVFVAGAAAGRQGHPRLHPPRRRRGRTGRRPPGAERKVTEEAKAKVTS